MLIIFLLLMSISVGFIIISVPFNVEKQKKILAVGACLTCHNEDSEVMKGSMNNFEELLKKRSGKCVIPDWN